MDPIILSREEIFSRLPVDFPWQIVYLTQTDSTNSHAKRLAAAGAPHGTVVIADRQTGGRGRRGRSFHSPAGSGVYMSVILRPNCAPGALMHLTCAVAVAVCDAIEAAAGFRPGIKWTNDLVYESRKLTGILTELGFGADGSVAYAIVGVGINCCQGLADFPEDIRDMAGSLQLFSPRTVCRADVASELIRALHRMNGTLLTGREALLARYRADCITLGREVALHSADGSIRRGKALDIDSEGALLVQTPDGLTERVNSGEVSVRGLYGYV